MKKKLKNLQEINEKILKKRSLDHQRKKGNKAYIMSGIACPLCEQEMLFPIVHPHIDGSRWLTCQKCGHEALRLKL